ncbi:helix-turn-helix domain-containing protein [Myroides odoratus]|uniref:helix-turn-helix domain-containing protein n=1 Tax=Myroides odoratus TaxID=256 RepID=UPI0039AEC58B
MKFRILFYILITTVGYAQTNAFDSFYQHTSRVGSTSTPQEALAYLKNLETLANTKKEKIEVYLLKASLLRQYGVRDKAIATLKVADSLASIEKYSGLQARIQGALSTLYRESGIESLGRLALVKANYWSQSIQNPLELAILKGNLLQEQAYYHMNSGRFTDALIALNLGRSEFEKIESPAHRFFYLASTDQLIGENYLRLEKIDQAIATLVLALEELEDSHNPESPLKGFIYKSLGISYLFIQDYETSFSFLDKAYKVAEQSDFAELKKQVLASLKEYAKQVEDTKKYLLYNEMYMQLVEQEFGLQTKIADYLVETYYEKVGETKQAYENYVLYSLAIGGGTLLFFSFTFYLRKQRIKKNTQAVLEQPVLLATLVRSEGESKKNENTVDHSYISKEMEELILSGIRAFEMQKGFLKHEISLSKLASQIGVNHRYLSYVIKHHKQQDFSSYINTLRIDYVILLLQENPEMLKYKISYLADLCGFASHSRFTITFKRIKGISPSTFIDQIKDKN